MPKKIVRPKQKRTFHHTPIPAITSVIALSTALLLVSGYALWLIVQPVAWTTEDAAKLSLALGSSDRQEMGDTSFNGAVEEFRLFTGRLGKPILALEKVAMDAGSFSVTPGRWLLSAQPSNASDKLIYTEVEACVRDLSGTCVAWKTFSYLKNSLTGLDQPIEIAADPAFCGGTLLPIGWTKNDKRIVWQLENLGAEGDGCLPRYRFFTSSAEQPSRVEAVATEDAFFIGQYVGVVYTDDSPKTIPMDQRGDFVMLNHGQLVYRNLETNVVTILKEQQNMNYMIRPELTGGGTVVYDVEDMIPVKSCTPMVDCYQKAKKTLKVGLKVALPKE